MWFELLLLTLFFWIFFTFLLPILTFPRMPIIRMDLPSKMPEELNEVIKRLNKIKDKERFVIAALEYLKKNFESKIYYLFIKLHKHFYKDANVIVREKGFWPCHIQSFILRLILVKSGKFKDEDVQIHYTFYSGIIHEYLKVKINNKWVNVDSWGYLRGVPFSYHTMGPLIDWFRFRLFKIK